MITKNFWNQQWRQPRQVSSDFSSNNYAKILENSEPNIGLENFFKRLIFSILQNQYLILHKIRYAAGIKVMTGYIQMMAGNIHQVHKTTTSKNLMKASETFN